jgi:hypothetical protein
MILLCGALRFGSVDKSVEVNRLNVDDCTTKIQAGTKREREREPHAVAMQCIMQAQERRELGWRRVEVCIAIN